MGSETATWMSHGESLHAVKVSRDVDVAGGMHCLLHDAVCTKGRITPLMLCAAQCDPFHVSFYLEKEAKAGSKSKLRIRVGAV